MKAMRRRSLVAVLRLRGWLPMALLAPAVLLLTTTGTAVLAGAYRNSVHGQDAARSSHADPQRTRVSRAGLRGTPPEPTTRRWPAEIEHLLSSAPPLDEGDGDVPPTVETDQRCSRVEDGLAHCVMLECQTAGEQTACFEMVVTARRLREPPGWLGGGDDSDDAPGAYEDHPLEAPLDAPSLLDTRHAKRPRPALPGTTTRS